MKSTKNEKAPNIGLMTERFNDVSKYNISFIHIHAPRANKLNVINFLCGILIIFLHFDLSIN